MAVILKRLYQQFKIYNKYNMENKYYTPTLDEFYIGFEFETLYNDKFEEAIVLFWADFEDTTYNLSPNRIRVKYLDQSDLEELGFQQYTYLRDGGTQVFRNLNKEYEIYFYRTNSISDIDPDKVKIIRHHENPSIKGQIFDGKIKNKSELKKLLKQLNIK